METFDPTRAAQALDELAGEARDNGNSDAWIDAQTAIVRGAMMPAPTDEETVRQAVASVLEFYREAGYIVRVEQAPNKPLAMRNDRDVVTVHRRQVTA